MKIRDQTFSVIQEDSDSKNPEKKDFVSEGCVSRTSPARMRLYVRTSRIVSGEAPAKADLGVEANTALQRLTRLRLANRVKGARVWGGD